MKVFISQPMKGKDNVTILKERQEAIGYIKKDFGSDIEIIDSFFQNSYHVEEPIFLLGESIKLMQQADVVYFCKGWEHSNGCYIEHECAVRYNKEMIYA